jgi:hypothetical protein
MDVRSDQIADVGVQAASRNENADRSDPKSATRDSPWSKTDPFTLHENTLL